LILVNVSIGYRSLVFHCQMNCAASLNRMSYFSSGSESAAIFDIDQSSLRLSAAKLGMEWKPITSAPFDRDLEVAVIDYDGTHAVVFACRRMLHGWIKAATRQPIELRPTHWREWQDQR
jgi:hypothetical protein